MKLLSGLLIVFSFVQAHSATYSQCRMLKVKENCAGCTDKVWGIVGYNENGRSTIWSSNSSDLENRQLADTRWQLRKLRNNGTCPKR